MPEMWIDPESLARQGLLPDRQLKFIIFCAGAPRPRRWRPKTAQDMGLMPVAHLEGGLSAWKKAGGPVAKVEAKK